MVAPPLFMQNFGINHEQGSSQTGKIMRVCLCGMGAGRGNSAAMVRKTLLRVPDRAHRASNKRV